MDSNMIPISMETPICVGDIYSTHKYILMKMIRHYIHYPTCYSTLIDKKNNAPRRTTYYFALILYVLWLLIL